MGLQDMAGFRAQPVGQDPVRPSFSVILLFSGHSGFLWGITLALTVTRTAFARPADRLALSSSGSAGHDGMPASLVTRESQKVPRMERQSFRALHRIRGEPGGNGHPAGSSGHRLDGPAGKVISPAGLTCQMARVVIPGGQAACIFWSRPTYVWLSPPEGYPPDKV